MLAPLLTTKLYAPPIRPGLVPRPRLIRKLNQGLQAGSQLTLITAPAGYGKTTLALEWLAGLGRPVAWLSVDREDNHPVQFLSYLSAALAQVEEPLGCAGPAAPQGIDEPAWVQARLTALVNQLALARAPLVLALDDYHTITDLGVHRALGFVLEHQPAPLHLVIITRQDPLLPLSRLRSRGLVTEIRLGELRFDRDEARQFLHETMNLDLPPDQVAILEARTEGWIAGLQLAALSLSERPAGSPPEAASGDRATAIEAFSGDERHVVDYLMDEVLSRQPEDIQRFLLRTSVLTRLCGPLCDALLDDGPPRAPNDESASAQRPSSFVLEQLERSNLFVIPLDGRRQWWRYHHLFGELLSSRLQASNPGLAVTLHGRASQWYEQAGMFTEAVDHALLADDSGRALRLIEHTAQTSIWASGDLPVLLNWSRRLPETALLARPRLCLYYARALFFAGQVQAAEGYLQAAEKALRARPGPASSGDEMWGLLFTNQATVRAMQGDSQAALDLADQARPRIAAGDGSTRARIAHAVGMAHYLQGEVLPAEAAFAEAAHLAQQAANHNLGLDCVSCQALTLSLAGRLSQAEEVCRKALEDDPRVQRLPAAGPIYLALGLVQYERYDLPGALAALDASLELGHKANWPHVLWQAYVLQALARQAAGDGPGALAAEEQAEQVAAGYPLPRVARMISACRARLALAQGDDAFAEHWAADYRSLGQPAEGELRDFEDLTLARAMLAGDEAAEAQAQLERLLALAQPAGRTATVVDAMLLRSQALVALGEYAAGRQALHDALALAEPEGLARAFLEAGSALAPQLAQVATRRGGAVEGFIGHLLAAASYGSAPDRPARPDGHGSTVSVKRKHEGEQGGLIEPLSERELEVLQLIADGLSNPEVAARLYLSVNTLRAHTFHIYQKLDVHNRVQAVKRARELGLLARE